MKCPVPGCPGEIKFVEVNHIQRYIIKDGKLSPGYFISPKEDVRVRYVCTVGFFHALDDNLDNVRKEMRPTIWRLPEEYLNQLPENIRKLSEEWKKEYLISQTRPKKF